MNGVSQIIEISNNESTQGRRGKSIAPVPRLSLTEFTCSTHLPPWREGWISAERKSPKRSNRMFLSAISLENEPPLCRSAGFILLQLITTTPEEQSTWSRQSKVFGSIDHFACPSPHRTPPLLRCCFYSGPSCQQYREAAARKERERERGRDTHMEGESGIDSPPYPSEGVELSAKQPYLWDSRERLSESKQHTSVVTFPSRVNFVVFKHKQEPVFFFFLSVPLHRGMLRI